MQSLEISSPDSSAQTLSRAPAVTLPFTTGWFLRRMALWMLLVGLGIGGACLLYVAASQAETEAAARGSGGETIARAMPQS